MKNELNFDLGYFYENKLDTELVAKRKLEDKERQIELKLEDVNFNISKIKASMQMIGETKVLNEALKNLEKRSDNLTTELQAVKELQYKLTDECNPKDIVIEVLESVKTYTPELERLYNKIKNFIFYSSFDLNYPKKNTKKIFYIKSKIKSEKLLLSALNKKIFERIFILRIPAIIGKDANSTFIS